MLHSAPRSEADTSGSRCNQRAFMLMLDCAVRIPGLKSSSGRRLKAACIQGKNPRQCSASNRRSDDDGLEHGSPPTAGETGIHNRTAIRGSAPLEFGLCLGQGMLDTTLLKCQSRAGKAAIWKFPQKAWSNPLAATPLLLTSYLDIAPMRRYIGGRGVKSFFAPLSTSNSRISPRALGKVARLRWGGCDGGYRCRVRKQRKSKDSLRGAVSPKAGGYRVISTGADRGASPLRGFSSILPKIILPLAVWSTLVTEMSTERPIILRA